MKRLSLLALTGVLTALLVVPAAAPAAKKAKPPKQLYVSLGDSYATGYQPTAQGVGHNTKHGFAFQVPGLAKPRGYDFKLVNFGCGGATTTSILESKGCPVRARAVGGKVYTNKTQAKAAEAFLKANRGKVGLITVSIGGNDVTSCVSQADPTTCVANNIKTAEANIKTLVKGLRTAAGPNVRIIGTTYPDVVLGGWVNPGTDSSKSLADLSQFAFKSIINPALERAYKSVKKGSFVDVTTATDSYIPLKETTTLAPYGVVPKAVARICQLTYYCQFRDIHSRTSGYKIIAQLIAKDLPKR